MTGHQHDLDELRVTTLRFPVVHYDRLREIATANHRTVSQEMRAMIERHIAWHDSQDQAAA
jgi:predicted DNA-binding protein